MQRQQVVFLMSDTGGGHRAAAEAICAALDARYPSQYTCHLVDVYRRYTPFPFNHMPEIYPRWVNWAAFSWGLGYHFANAPRRGHLVMAVLRRLWQDGMARLANDYPADVIVCVHPLFARPALYGYSRARAVRPRFVTVITDLVSTHAFWYEPGVDRCLVPTQAAWARGLKFGLRPEQMRVTGLPVHPEFVNNLLPKDEARRRLGWDLARPALLLMGGGDGMGPVYEAARALNARRLPIQLAIIAGRNQALFRRLQASAWNQPTRVYPFVTNMPELMAAADILVSKAGPATICEACAAGLPVVLSGAVPGQENGNVTYLVENGAGAYAKGAAQMVETVSAWLAEGPAGLARRSARALALAHSDAVWEVAAEIHHQAGQPPVSPCSPVGHAVPLPPVGAAREDGWVYSIDPVTEAGAFPAQPLQSRR